MPEIETPEQQRDEALLACPVCGEMVEYENGVAIKLWNDEMRKYRRRFLIADAAQQRVEELEKGIRELLPSFNDRFWDMCSYAEHLSELKSKLTSLLEGE